MNAAFSFVLLFILLDCVTNEKPPYAKGCHVSLTAFYRPVKVLQEKIDLNNISDKSLKYPTLSEKIGT